MKAASIKRLMLLYIRASSCDIAMACTCFGRQRIVGPKGGVNLRK